MPNKDPERRREVVRNAVRRYRERKKEEREKVIVSPDGTYKAEIIDKSGKKYLFVAKNDSGKPMTAAEIEEISQMSKVLEEAVELLGMKEAIKIFRACFEQEGEKKDSFKSMTSFIPDLLSMHVDLKTLKQRGGTPCL